MNEKRTLRFLVVDDSLLIRKILEEMIEVNLGHKVIGFAKNGNEAVTMYEKLKPDIVTLDIDMPDLNGNEALKIIKRRDKDSKVIMMTVKGEKEIVSTSLRLKANGYILKPPSPDKLYDIIIKIFPDAKDFTLEREKKKAEREDFDKFYEIGDFD